MGKKSKKKKKKRHAGDLSPYEGMVILNFARGTVELAFPRFWSVEPDPRGYFRIEDPEENAVLELSALFLPPGPIPPDFPSAARQLRDTLVARSDKPHKNENVYRYHEDPKDLVIHNRPHFGIDMAWTDYTYDAPDRGRNDEERLAHGRYLVATNRSVQTLWTYYYWEDYAAYGVEWWERMVATLQLGRISQPTGIFEHWRVDQPKPN